MARPKNTREQNIEAFWKRVNRRGPKECWNWTGWIQKLPKGSGGGYGKFCYGHSKYYLPHRFVWELKHGPIPHGMLVCHHCDNRACCNPEHLFLGTHRDNTQDSIKKGRWIVGEKNPCCVLSNADVLEIRRRYVPRRGVRLLAKEFGVAPKYIWALAHNKARVKYCKGT